MKNVSSRKSNSLLFKKETRTKFQYLISILREIRFKNISLNEISISRMDVMKFYDRRYFLDLIMKLIVHVNRDEKNDKNF